MNINRTREQVATPQNGWPFLIASILLALFTVAALATFQHPWPLIFVPLVILTLRGLFIVNPNRSRVLVLFGRYVGSVKKEGFYWTNPFAIRHHLTLRAQNLDSSTIKVNDLLGNPIEISAVVVWRVSNTGRAQFDVEDYEHFVQVQSDAAMRSLATSYPYDDLEAEGSEITLRGSTDVVAEQLQDALARRLDQAGVEVLEARLNHLAYAPEIASAMLQRQQAKAIIAARKQIVEGAVGMVEMALDHLESDKVLELDAQSKANLVGNLLVVLCGQSQAMPVLNTGSTGIV